MLTQAPPSLGARFDRSRRKYRNALVCALSVKEPGAWSVLAHGHPGLDANPPAVSSDFVMGFGTCRAYSRVAGHPSIRIPVATILDAWLVM